MNFLLYSFIFYTVKSQYGEVTTICDPNSMGLVFEAGYFDIENFVNYTDLYMNGLEHKVGPVIGDQGMLVLKII